jgi:hypothetical protein
MNYEKSKKIRFLLFIVIPVSILSLITFGFWLVYLIFVYFTCGILYRLSHFFFSRIILPFYIRWQAKGDKFLIRFNDHELPDVTQRIQRRNHAGQMSKTAVLLLVFLLAIIAQTNIDTATTGKGIDAYRCPDGSVELYAKGCASLEDPELYPICTDGCSSELAAVDKIQETFFSLNAVMLYVFAPFITAITAPLMVMRHSSLSIVNKKTKSITPIGAKLTDITNAAMGFGSLVIFAKTAYSIAQTAATADESAAFLMYMATGITIAMIWLFYPTIWLASAKFAKVHPKLVRDLDARVTLKSGLKTHYLESTDGGLTISPTSQ